MELELELELENGIVPGPIDGPAIERALASLGPDGERPSFAILSKTAADQDNYVQTSVDEEGFLVEKREGHAGAHFVAMRLKSSNAPQSERKWLQLWKVGPEPDRFTLAEIQQIFRSHMDGSEPTFWKWVPLEFGR